MLTVSGSGERYIVFASFGGDAEMYSRVAPAKSADDEEIVVTGGQAGRYPADTVVTKHMARQAVAEFCAHGTMCAQLCWRRD